MTNKYNQINNDWDTVLSKEFREKKFRKTIFRVKNERKKNTILPNEDDVFNALKLTSFQKTKIIIIGQDPYHNKSLSHGIAFSVPKNKKKPPSLRNIFKELEGDLNIKPPKSGNLEAWAKQGVLLLNTILTVKEGQAGSHKHIGWQNLTDKIISKLSCGKSSLVFLLWGKYAQTKERLINTNKHYVLKTTHPSPFSAHKGFFGCKHFSKTNEILQKHGKTPIYWQLTEQEPTLF